MITHTDLLKILKYNPMTGIFTKDSRRRKNVVVGYLHPDGYMRISVKGVKYLGQRLAWFYVHGDWPTQHIDHINQNKADNRLSNLRLASRLENSRNRKVFVNNKCGYKGVHFVSNLGKYRAIIKYEGKPIHLGYFHYLDDAALAYNEAATTMFGDYASLNVINKLIDD